MAILAVDSSPRDLEQRLADALGQLETRTRELAGAQEQQAAMSAILRIISSSPTDRVHTSLLALTSAFA